VCTYRALSVRQAQQSCPEDFPQVCNCEPRSDDRMQRVLQSSAIVHTEQGERGTPPSGSSRRRTPAQRPSKAAADWGAPWCAWRGSGHPCRPALYFVSRVVCLAVCALSVQVLHFNQDRRAVVYADRAETPALSAVIPLRSHKGLHPCAQSAADSTEHLFLLTAEPLQFPCTPSGLPEADGSLVTGELLYRHCQLQPWR